MPVHTPGDPRPADATHAGRSRSAPPSLRSPPSRFHVMNAIIAYLPSGDKKVIIPSAHRYFIICPWARSRARASAIPLSVAPTGAASANCYLMTVEEEVIMQLCAKVKLDGIAR